MTCDALPIMGIGFRRRIGIVSALWIDRAVNGCGDRKVIKKFSSVVMHIYYLMHI